MSEPRPEVPLNVLDPGYTDPGYWERFQRRVMASARPHLAQRRRNQLTVEGLMLSWGRMILPLAAAAVVAALTLLPGGTEEALQELAGVEEVVDVPDPGEAPLPEFLHTDQIVDRDLMLFALEAP